MPIPDNKSTGILRYIKNISTGQVSVPINLWITHITQDNQLTGVTGQSLKTRHFYPRSYGPGDYVIEGIVPSQEDLQHLALYIRSHQEYMVNNATPILTTVTSIDPTPFQLLQGQTTPISRKVTGYSGLLTLEIPNENINTQGWISRFTILKRGVFEPAPTYTFNFTIAQDSNSPYPVANTSFEIANTFLGLTPNEDIRLSLPWKPPNNIP